MTDTETKPSLFKRIFSILKKIIIILVLIVLALGIIGALLPREDYVGVALSTVMNSVMGIPHYQRDYIKNDAADIVKLSAEEWMNLQCEPVGFDKSDIVFGANYTADKLPLKEKYHLNCISVSGISAWGSVQEQKKSIHKKLCSHCVTCDTIVVMVNGYVLQKPEILWNMIKIAERPLDYVKGGVGARRFVIIIVSDFKNKRDIEIVVRRKDID